MRKKILIVIESLGCGGAEKSLVSMLPLLDYNKYEVDLLVHNKGTGLFESLVEKKVNVLPSLEFVEFCKKSILQELLTLKFTYIISRIKWAYSIRKKSNRLRHSSEIYWENCKSAFQVMEKEYDVAIAWGQGNSTHYVADKVIAKKKYAWINADYVLGNHDKEYDAPFYEKMDRIVVVSNQLLTMTRKVFPEHASGMRVIYDVVNADLIKAMAEKEEVLTEKTGLKIVTIGRLEKPKGYNIAIEACKILKDKGIDFTWYVIGDGTEREFLESKIREYALEENFVLLGVKANPYVYLKKADIYVQTSVFEGYCITLAEARMLNKPIVTTNFDVVYDQICDEKTGLIVQMNPEAVAEGVIRLINDKTLRESIEANLKKEKKGNVEEVYKFMALLDE